jgi:hypothetical protein
MATATLVSTRTSGGLFLVGIAQRPDFVVSDDDTGRRDDNPVAPGLEFGARDRFDPQGRAVRDDLDRARAETQAIP